MRIQYTKNGGFVEIIENGIVEKVVCSDDDGTCIVHFYDKPPKRLKIGCSVYNRQYGIPVSEDGSKLFIGSWEKGFGGLEKGLMAYDIESGLLLWHLKEGKIRSILVQPNYLVVLKAGAAIFKLDIDTGKVLKEIKSGTIENLFDLGGPYALVDSIKGNLSVVDTEKMLVVKKYNSKVVNPSNLLSIVIQNATLQGNIITIYGVEGGQYSTTHGATNQNSFVRAIDTCFNPVYER